MNKTIIIGIILLIWTIIDYYTWNKKTKLDIKFSKKVWIWLFRTDLL